MIRFIFIQNVLGKTRMAKYYVPYEDAEKHKIEYEVHRLVSSRNSKFANTVEVRIEPLLLLLRPHPIPSHSHTYAPGPRAFELLTPVSSLSLSLSFV